MRSILSRLAADLALRRRGRARHLRIGYFTRCEDLRFGNYNTIHHFANLKDVTLGDLTYVANGARIVHANLGKFCSIGPNCRIGLGVHPSRDFVTSHPAFYSTRGQAQLTFVERNLFADYETIEIGHDVWVGEGALVMDGVRIGNGAIIGAGAVVTRDVPDFAVVAGVPARLIRYRFSDADIAFLNEFRWWDRDIAWLRANAPYFSSVAELRAAP